MNSESLALSVFISYAHKDNESAESSKRWLDRLVEHLEPLIRQNQVVAWSDRDIEAGEDWHEEIQTALQNSKAAVLLVSPAFLASKYIANSELPVMLKQAKDRGLVIIPIVLRHSLFREVTFKYPDPINGPDEFTLASLQAANSPEEPLNQLPEHQQDEVLVSVARRLLSIVHPATVPRSGLPPADGERFSRQHEATRAPHSRLLNEAVPHAPVPTEMRQSLAELDRIIQDAEIDRNIGGVQSRFLRWKDRTSRLVKGSFGEARATAFSSITAPDFISGPQPRLMSEARQCRSHLIALLRPFDQK